jgi:hypothetical protein
MEICPAFPLLSKEVEPPKKVRMISQDNGEADPATFAGVNCASKGFVKGLLTSKHRNVFA